MNKVVKTMLITIAVNVILGALIYLGSIAANPNDNNDAVINTSLLLAAALLIQLVAGLVMSGGTKSGKTGQGMLLAVGILFVIGFAVCSNINVRL